MSASTLTIAFSVICYFVSLVAAFLMTLLMNKLTSSAISTYIFVMENLQCLVHVTSEFFCNEILSWMG